MEHKSSERVAWLLPAMGTGGISFQHILTEFAKIYPHTITFTGQWPGYAPGHEDTFKVQEVGATKHIKIASTSHGYEVGFSYASPSIVSHLLRFKPQVIFANAFSIWTVIALLFKQMAKCKVIIVYEGGSPSYESSGLSVRLVARKLMVQLADAFVANSKSGKSYLVNTLGVKTDRVFTRPFLVPSVKALLQCPSSKTPKFDPQMQRPIFLYVGQLIPRKGVKILLEACKLLEEQGHHNYTLMIVGDGEQRQELEAFARDCGLIDRVQWLGRVEYGCLGAYFQFADLFVFPTYEDIWGMVLTEAMVFGKPVICSRGASAAEMVIEGENGFIFETQNSQQLAEYMSRFLENLSLIKQMGEKSQQIMINHNPADATKSFLEAMALVQNRSS